MADPLGHPPVEAKSSWTHASPDPHAKPSSSHLSTGRNYGNGGCLSHQLRHHAQRTSLRPVHVGRWAALGVAPIGSSTTPWTGGTIPRTSLG